jgi:hypothetical protein
MLEDDFQLDRGPERKARDAIHQSARALVSSEDVLQQRRGGVGDLRLIADTSRILNVGPPVSQRRGRARTREWKRTLDGALESR